MLSLIMDLKNRMRVLLTKYSRFKQEEFEAPFVNLDKLDHDKLQEIYQFLLNFHNDYYLELERIFNLPLVNSPNGPELWDRYFKAGKHHLVEMKMLRKQANRSKVAWSRRPKFKEQEPEPEVSNGEESPVRVQRNEKVIG